MRRVLSGLLLLVALAICVWRLAWPTQPEAADKEKVDVSKQDFSKELPRIPPTSPKDALKTFQTLPGFHMEQAAAEPLVHTPVAFDFDENGRMFVAEMIDYSEQDKEFLGAVRVLEDTDGDGKYDTSDVYVDKLSWPTAIICWDGGVFIGAAPDLYYCKDTNGDNKADVRKVAYTGFNRNNVQGLINSFHWGLDNRIHGATSTVGGLVKRPDQPEVPAVSLNGRDFSFAPRTMALRPESGGAQHGMCFDDWGRKFVCSNSDHIQLVMYEDRYIARNPYLAAPGPRISIAADGPQAEVYRISPVEPWRIVRTRLRASGAVPGIVEGGGRPAGYFTGATGTTIYRGDAWPAEYRGQAFVGDVGSNIVHRKVLVPDGAALIANRVDDKKEFVASTDIWFRPAQYANAPDGTLYICDVYREVIEHPASLPEPIKKHLDLTSGRDRGRIYRIAPDGFKSKPAPKLGSASTAELVATLAHRNSWHREAASKVLFLRQDQSAVPLLEKQAQHSDLPEGRMHSLYALSGMSALTPEVVLTALHDSHPRVREHAVKLAEQVAADSAPIREAIVKLAGDPDLLVQYQVAFTLGEIQSASRNAALAMLLKSHAGDKWIRLAVFSSLSQGASDVLTLLLADNEFRASAGGREVLAMLVSQIGVRARQEDVAIVLQRLAEFPESDAILAAVIVRAMSDGLTKANSPLKAQLTSGKSGQVLEQILKQSRAAAADDKQLLANRVDAVRTLALGSFAADGALLSTLLTNKQPQELQLAAIDTLARFPNVESGNALLEAWSGFSPKVRAAATEAVFSRAEWLVAFLNAVEKEDVPLSDVEPGRIKLLSAHADPRVREKAKALEGRLQIGKRQDVIEAYKGALTAKGDFAKGKIVFQKICAACHRLENFGQEIGPSLATVRNRGVEAVLVNVLDPNREVNPQYINYTLQTTDGKTVTGIIAAETATSVTLKRAEGMTDVVLRAFIDDFRSSGVSIMPEGLEKQIDVQSMADVLEYLMNAK